MFYKRPLGFAGPEETAEFFGLTIDDVQTRCDHGDWRFWIIGGKRVFNLDELVEQLAKQQEATA